MSIPRGRKFLTRTTTRTLPAGDGLGHGPQTASGGPTGTTTPSLARRDGVDAVDLNAGVEAVDEA